MSWIDVGLVAVFVLYGIIGLFQGFIVQCFRLGGIVCVFFYARFVAEPFGQWLAGVLSLNPLLAYYISLVFGALVVYAVCSLTGRAVHRIVSSGGGVSRKVNRWLGAATGLAKGFLIAFLLASIIDMIPAGALDRWKWAQADVEASNILPVVHGVNPLPHLRFLADLDDYKKLLEDKEAQLIFQKQPDFVRLHDHPKFRLAANDLELQGLIKDKAWRKVLLHKRVVALAFDREVRDILNKLNPKAALEQAEASRKAANPE